MTQQKSVTDEQSELRSYCKVTARLGPPACFSLDDLRHVHNDVVNDVFYVEV
jgi:hypothetical protein